MKPLTPGAPMRLLGRWFGAGLIILALGATPLATAANAQAPASGSPTHWSPTEASATPPPGLPDAPVWTLPTPPGEAWEVIQGYNCGTHTDWDRLSFDLANSDGRTRGAPVRAAADGAWWHWVADSGTLLVKHAGGYYTMYTHMESHVDLPSGTPIARGMQLGTVGNVGAEHTVPHLHFTVFYQEPKARGSAQASARIPVALEFADGETYAEDGSCNQYDGAVLRAPAGEAPMMIDWGGAAERTWLAEGEVAWQALGAEAARVGWDTPPVGASPTQALSGTAGLRPGRHTFYVSAWRGNGADTAIFTRELWLDPVPPLPPDAASAVLTRTSPLTVRLGWAPAHDDISGVAGYDVMIVPVLASGRASQSPWFLLADSTEIALGYAQSVPGRVLVRARDAAGNVSPWSELASLAARQPSLRPRRNPAHPQPRSECAPGRAACPE